MRSEFRNKMSCSKVFFVLAFCLFFLFCLYGHDQSWAQQEGYPNKPIKIIVPFGPGASSDLAVRTMTDYLSKELKVPIIIENKPGADSMIGTVAVLKANPDGYTLLAGSDPALVHGPLGSPNPPYDPFKDLLPVGGYSVSPHVYTVYASSPFKTITDFVNEAKKNPGKVSVGATQLDSRLKVVKFEKVAGIDLKIIPFQATSELVSAIIGKHVDLMALTYAASSTYIKSGEIRLLFANFRIPGYSVPTLAEAGYPEAGTVVTRNGLLVSAKTPKSIYEKLVVTLERVSKNPELHQKLENLGLIPDYKTPTQFTDDTKKKWEIEGKLMEELGLIKK
jgi:tripartite-type tricarboxylate transporter receptor subunit TctC